MFLVCLFAAVAALSWHFFGCVALLAVVAMMLVLFLIYCCHQPRTLPPAPVFKRLDMTKDHFNQNKIPDPVDFVIIGSGIGGLTTGALLSRLGHRVLVLEQHYVAGGCTHTFEEKGFEFETGVHYIPSKSFFLLCEPLFNIVNPDNTLRWYRLGAAEDGVYCEANFGRFCPPFKYRSDGLEAKKAALKERFAEEAANIDAFFDSIARMESSTQRMFLFHLLPDWLARLVGPCLVKKFKRLAALSGSRTAQTFTKNKELIAILFAEFIDLATIPENAPWNILGPMTAEFSDGAVSPVGGGSAITRALISPIERAGGRVLVKAPVTKLVFNAGHSKVLGVEVKNKVRIFPKKGVISAVNLRCLLDRLMPVPAVERWPRVPDLVHSLNRSESLECLWLGLDGTTEELGLVDRVVMHLPLDKCGGDLDVMMHEHYKHALNPTVEDIPCLIVFPSAKDPDYQNRHSGKSTCCVMALAKYEWFEDWEAEPSGHRGRDYELKKQVLARKMRRAVEKNFPLVRGRIVYEGSASPVTNNHYLGVSRGECMGLISCERMSQLDAIRASTPFNNLWLSGQDIFLPGVTPSMISSLITVCSVVGFPRFMGWFIRNMREQSQLAKKRQ